MSEKKGNINKKVVGRRRAVADSDESSTECEKELLLPSTSSTEFCKNCCSCNGGTYKIKSREKHLPVTDSKLSRTSYREQLEMKVLNEQVSQQVSSDQWKQLEVQLSVLSEACTTIRTLLNSVHVSSTCLMRLSRILSDSGSESDQICRQICDKINEALALTRSNDFITIGETNDFLSKKDDLIKASSNFVEILHRNSLPSNKQLSKLEKQFDDIKNRYTDSKSKAVISMSERIRKGSDTLNCHIKKLLIPILTSSSDMDKNILPTLHGVNPDLILKKLESCHVGNIYSVGKCSLHKAQSFMGAAGEYRRNKVCTCYDSSE